MNAVDPKVVQFVARFAQVGLRVLSERALTYLGFVASTAIFAYALYEPTWQRAAIASAFAVLIYWPTMRMERKQVQQGETHE